MQTGSCQNSNPGDSGLLADKRKMSAMKQYMLLKYSKIERTIYRI
ncbi:hypothetical protein AAEU38_17585 [Bacteroides thetaiotaomicron]|nr:MULTISPECIES: hypothetical protein [Bacteroides]MCQ5208827.1 hypothetical protein [Bacteroides thetaiotaomicron]MCS2191103.1 hypothetical protein [Bacteroides thetaiotaomicron]MCS2277426.1 hypothetical protein [Bacteroides thetaiotaomicron]MCS2351179.1 hypothetical protein [Bacteroides thetaiotaomicron]MCS2449974.1 hypothetical protein [Bacteroides thetaiotaomicron]